MRDSMAYAGGALVALFLVVVFGIIAGWFMNIMALTEATALGVLEIVRLLGIVLLPLGAIMGWLF